MVETLIVFLKALFEKGDLEKKILDNKTVMKNYPVYKELNYFLAFIFRKPKSWRALRMS